MNETCPECGHLFEEEPGYFLGAMYVSYPIAAALMCGFWGLLVLIFPNVKSHVAVPISAVLFLPFVPMTFRYSRILWLHFATTSPVRPEK